LATGIFALFDDIAMLADDVAVASKIATKKTSAILGDDLAVNAEKATGFDQSRELAVIWAITKGSLKNKAIILPVAFLLSAFAHQVITYILMLGALYLLYEGAEKIEETLFHKKSTKGDKKLLASTKENILEIEEEKIRSAIVTDFILSIEIVVISLGVVMDKPLIVQVMSTVFVAFIATVGVYGIVALIVRMDNLGFWLVAKNYHTSGKMLIAAMPKLIKILGFVGTFAMLLVGGGILAHNVEVFHHYFVSFLPAIINELLLGFIIGILVLISVHLVKKVLKKVTK
jgi:predicted DNA repair protein MutK